MLENRRYLLQTMGRKLEFSADTIYGIPAFTMVNFTNGESSPYTIEVQEFIFHVMSEDALAIDLKIDDTFTFDDETHTLSFKVATKPKPDITGFFYFMADFISMVPL